MKRRRFKSQFKHPLRRKRRFAARMREHANRHEVILFGALAHAGLWPVRWQYPLCGFIVDLAFVKRHLAVEIDGRHHQGRQLTYDAMRDGIIRRRGWTILRYSNEAIEFHLDDVVNEIRRVVSSDLPGQVQAVVSKQEGRDMRPRLVKRAPVLSQAV